MNLETFARALRLRWPWLEWKDPSKMRVGMGNPCNNVDIDLFYTSTVTTIRNGGKVSFRDSPWL